MLHVGHELFFRVRMLAFCQPGKFGGSNRTGKAVFFGQLAVPLTLNRWCSGQSAVSRVIVLPRFYLAQSPRTAKGTWIAPTRTEVLRSGPIAANALSDFTRVIRNRERRVDYSDLAGAQRKIHQVRSKTRRL
jgi:hypothetical protein